jgi:hypothetical protein
MENILNRLFEAADNHAEDTGEADHAVGDLQSLLVRACGLLSAGQKLAFLGTDEVAQLVEGGARDEFDVDELKDEINRNLYDMQQSLKAEHYQWDNHPLTGWFWKKDRHLSPFFNCWHDAVEDAYKDMLRRKADPGYVKPLDTNR